VNPTWTVDPAELTEVFEELEFDVETADTSLPGGGGSLTARRERGNRAVLVKVDAGGRLQVLLTEELADDAAAPQEIGGVRLTITDTTIRRRTLRGTLSNVDQLRAVIESFTQEDEQQEPPPV
jgi:hypothetical protein